MNQNHQKPVFFKNYLQQIYKNMKITLILVGKTDDPYIEKGMSKYLKRLKHYVNFETKIIPALKNTKKMSTEIQKKLEGEKIIQMLPDNPMVVVLDEKGKQLTSAEFSKTLENKMSTGIRNVIFVIGGPYGFSEEVYNKANEEVSLSKMTFPHQLVRLIFMEQLYRAFTIIRNESYHH